MAFDFGLRQIGVATGNTVLGTTTALPVLRARDGVPDWEALARLVQEWEPDVLVVGDPLHMDGAPSELGKRARRFARQLHGRLGLPVEMADERLSSFEAKQQRRNSGHRGDFRQDPVDSDAAGVILRTWLQESSRG